MPLLVEWTCIMDWHRLERVAFGIKESRHRGRGSKDLTGSGGGWAWLQGAWLPSQPHMYIRSPMYAHKHTHAHVFVRLDPVNILVCGPISTFIYECLSICLSMSGVKMNGALGWFLFSVTDLDLPSQFTIPTAKNKLKTR